MSPPNLGKGLIFLGSFAGPAIFASLHPKQSRLVETTGEVTGNLWNEVRVGPWFDGWRMKEGAGTGNMAYSYGYVLRMTGSEHSVRERRAITNETSDITAPISGELTLIETRLRPRERGWLTNKNSIEPVIGGYTGKKFVLVGVNEVSNEVEFQGLVSIVKDEKESKANCWKEFKEGPLWESIKTQFSGSGLLLSGQYEGRYSKQGRALVGNCSKEFYKNKSDSEIPFIEELKGENASQIGLQELNIDGGMSIAIAVGQKTKGLYKKEIIAPGILVKNKFDDGKTLWVGLSGDGKAKMMGGAGTNYRKRGQGWMAIHDWKSTKSEENLQRTKEGKVEAKKITLDPGRKYYLWDPSFTRIVKGELVTKDGKQVPWKVNTKLPFTSKLIK